MKWDFTQTASITAAKPIPADFCERVTVKLRREHEMNYQCKATDDGYFMKPAFSFGYFSWYHNSFVPEVSVSVAQEEDATVLHLTGKPLTTVRVFMLFYICFALLMEVSFLALIASSEMDRIYPLFIPILMGLFFYFLCKICTKYSFQSIVSTIKQIVQ